MKFGSSIAPALTLGIVVVLCFGQFREHLEQLRVFGYLGLHLFHQEPFFSPIDTARLSLVDDSSFVTETLAGIYEAQGYLDKAIKAYKLLCLKYPEKSNTFAARIPTLEEQLKKSK